jgi:hypothetical protein
MTVMTEDKMTKYKKIVDNKVVSIKSIYKNTKMTTKMTRKFADCLSAESQS